MDWHKGTALNHLLNVLGLKDAPDLTAIYLGDDHTDEDAFRTLVAGSQGTSPRESCRRLQRTKHGHVHLIQMLVGFFG